MYSSNYEFCMDITRQTSPGTTNNVNYCTGRRGALENRWATAIFKTVDSAAFLTIRQFIQ